LKIIIEFRFILNRSANDLSIVALSY